MAIPYAIASPPSCLPTPTRHPCTLARPVASLTDTCLGPPLASNAQTCPVPNSSAEKLRVQVQCFVSSSSLPPSTSTYHYPLTTHNPHNHPPPLTSPTPCPLPPAKRPRNDKSESLPKPFAIRSHIDSTRLVGWWMLMLPIDSTLPESRPGQCETWQQ